MKVSTLLSTPSMLSAFHSRFQSLFSKKFTFPAFCLSNSVGGQHNAVAGLKLQAIGT